MTGMDELFTEARPMPRTSQKSYEWYTPGSLMIAVRRVLGPIELDPASSELANKTVQAERFYDEQSNGLQQPWRARSLWLNPPYCKTGKVSNVEVWTSKLIAAYESGDVQEAMLLVNAATETAWFQRLAGTYAYPYCELRGRVHFNHPDNIDVGPTIGSAMFYLGPNIDRFIVVFRHMGAMMQSLLPRHAPASQHEGNTVEIPEDKARAALKARGWTLPCSPGCARPAEPYCSIAQRCPTAVMGRDRAGREAAGM
jgi:hypothetical protein